MSSIIGTEALFIDIDDTITTYRPETPGGPPNKVEGQSLLWLMADFAQRTKGTPREQSEAIIRTICRNVIWWHWSDFICELGLDAAAFWQYAYEDESKYLQAVDSGLPAIVDSLHKAGYRMFITSNNPSSGDSSSFASRGSAIRGVLRISCSTSARRSCTT